MPQLIGLALFGTALYCALRVLRREMRRIGEDLDHRPGTEGDRTTGASLVKDPVTGIYRPEDRS